jgi:hypothetical protein
MYTVLFPYCLAVPKYCINMLWLISDFGYASRAVCKYSLNLHHGIMLKFLDKFSLFALLRVTFVQKSPMEVFYILTPYKRKLTLIIKDFHRITNRHTPPL